MAYIVFGGNGFVGKHLVSELIKQGKETVVCDINNDNSSCKYLNIDIASKDSLETLDLKPEDIVINLAANQYHHKVPREAREEFFSLTNTSGLQHILEKMLACKCKNLVMFSTDMVYGKPQYLPVDTNHPLNPFGPYGLSKKNAEKICNQYRKEEGFNITIFRPRMIIGPGRLGILKKLFKLIDMNLPVPTIGNGKNCYQMISVFDCVSAILLAIDKNIPNSEYNLGSYNPPCTRDLLKRLIEKAGSKSIVIPTYGPLVKLALKTMGFVGLEIMYKEQYMIADENYILDISKTTKELGWVPQFSDMDMIVQSYEDYKKI